MEKSDGSLMGDKFVPDDEITEKEATGTMKHDPVDNMLISKRESKIKAPRKAQYSVIRFVEEVLKQTENSFSLQLSSSE